MTYSNVWSVFYFFCITYLFFITIFVTYVISFVSTNPKVFDSKFLKITNIYVGGDFTYVYLLLPTLTLLINNLWVGPITITWFGHILAASFQFKLATFISIIQLLMFTVVLTNFFFTARNVYDFMSTLIFFYYWLLFLFFVNSLLTVIFVIEALSSLVFLFMITSSFSSTTYYNNVSLLYANFYQLAYPNNYLKSLIFFFWISLLTSLFLFLFLTIFFLKFLTLDWFISESIFKLHIKLTNLLDLMSLSFVWFVLLFSIFLKCGIAPFFLWKPTFFKGLPLHTLFFYITFFYFYVYVYFIYFISTYFIDFLYFYSYIILIFVSFGFFLLMSIMLESLNLKIFLAISSVINSLFVLTVLISSHYIDFYFWL